MAESEPGNLFVLRTYNERICRRCKRLGQKRYHWPEYYFRSNEGRPPASGRQRQPFHYICRGCEIELRDKRRWLTKILGWLRRHVGKLARKFGMSVERLKKICHLDDPTEIARHAEEFWLAGGKCQASCARVFKDMPGGLGEMTLDHRDPARLPIWPYNWQYICKNENSQKQIKDDVTHALIQDCHKEYFSDLNRASAVVQEESASKDSEIEARQYHLWLAGS